MAAPPGQPTALKASVPQKEILLTTDDTEDHHSVYFNWAEELSENIVKIISLPFPLSNHLH